MARRRDRSESSVEIRKRPGRGVRGKPMVDLALKLLLEQIQAGIGKLPVHPGNIDFRIHRPRNEGGVVFFIDPGNLLKYIRIRRVIGHKAQQGGFLGSVVESLKKPPSGSGGCACIPPV